MVTTPGIIMELSSAINKPFLCGMFILAKANAARAELSVPRSSTGSAMIRLFLIKLL